MNSENGYTSVQKSSTDDDFRVDGDLLSDAATKAVKEELRSQPWVVYEHYEIVKENGRAFVVAPAKGTLNATDDAKHTYAPLHNPDLVVDLALMADTPITPEAILVWARQYGLMGFPEDDVVKLRDSGHRFIGYGRRDDVDRFARAAREVGKCLRIYEALTADTAEEALKEIIAELWSPPEPLSTKALVPPEHRAGNERPYLFRVLGKAVSMRLREHCHPKLLTYTTGGLAIGEFALSWGFKGLIGALWLQMAWLLEAEAERVKRCKLPDCLRVVHFEASKPPPDPGFKRNVRGKYRTRSDREFCKGRGCKQKYHYRKKAGWPGYH